ncbi:DNA-directed RNA polymerase subunit alpha [Patescibacteria group bacterium]|nr:DNA-directed RNA polymerase subunit alpha [Patescibacteria group bacterium]MBU1705395.1 DNA-directed RNA polymerase subunit alpha [Patescibacteria group bacterium]
MENILLPSTINYEPGERPNEGRLIVQPCYYGYGTTLGNALRRVLLSSLPGAAITAVKIKGVTHEFTSIENVKEDVLQVILNLKGLRLKSHSEEPVILKLKVTGIKTVTAADIDPNADVEIINQDLEIATITDEKATLEMELTVERGRGYSPTESRTNTDHDLGTIAIDALFSPIRNVGYKVENTRVGDITNYDRLIMNIETDGSIEPAEAVEQASKILIDYFSILLKSPVISDANDSTEAIEEAEPTEPEVE